jgi:MSHA pilin protein MshC
VRIIGSIGIGSDKRLTQAGFTLLELVAVLVIVGALAATSTSRIMPSSSLQLQSSRDQVVAAFFSAQQLAMAQAAPVRLTIIAPNQIDIRQDSDGDGDFGDEASLQLAGTRYPFSLLVNQALTPAIFNFDRLGRTAATSLSLSQSDVSKEILVSATGYIR